MDKRRAKSDPVQESTTDSQHLSAVEGVGNPSAINSPSDHPSGPALPDDLFRLIERSGLFEPKLFEEQRQRFRDSSFTVSSILAQMLKERLLTPFQAKQLSERRHRGFFLSEKYKILDFLGQGGMSRVLLCEHMLLQRLVAVKILNKSLDKFPGASERFLREARAAASMDHPHLARVFDVDRTSLGPCIVMEYVDGTNLHDLATKRQPLDIHRVAHFIRQAALGLQHAHLAGLVHRDVKPANLMLDRTGTIKLLDLGLARYFDPTRSDHLTQEIDASCIIGTADYIAPEQVMESSSADIRSDIYSLGYTMYFLLTRTLPAGTGAALRKLLWHQTREPEPVDNLRPDVPAELAAVLQKMINKKPDDRYRTPAEVVDALAPWTGEPLAPPASEEMPRTKASAYRLGLCPPPDSSKFTGTSSKGGSTKVEKSSRSSGGNSAKTESKTLSALDLPVQSSSVIADTDSGEVDSLRTTSSVIRSSTTDKVLSCVTETDVTGESSLIRNLANAVRMDQRIPRRPVVTLLVGGAAVAVCGWGLSWLFRKSSQPSSSAPNRIAANANAVPATRRSDDIEQTSYSMPAKGVVLRGGGSTFIRPALENWSSLYEKQTGVKIEYSAVGSSKGVDGLIANFLDFACTDVFLSDEQIVDAGGEIVHIPLALGAVAVAYNVPAGNSDAPLRFTGATLANIFLGNVRKWNDPAIAVSNPGRQLPDLDIVVVHRKEGSGTTAIWTEYLSRASSAWTSQVGTGSKVTWPVGIEVEKNDGLADMISRTSGAIGYVELNSARANGLKVGRVKNASGEFIQPSVETIASAAASLKNISADLRYSAIDSSGANSYPIVGACWAVFRKNSTNERKAALLQFLKWVTTEGQSQSTRLQYSPLPRSLSDRVTSVLDSEPFTK